ncbi:DUF1127 domain-containing protein [Mesorhizobium sp. M0488]
MIEVPERLVHGLLTSLRALAVQDFAIAGWWQRRETEHALRRLSDCDLRDMGIARRDIREIVRCGAVRSGTGPNRLQAAGMEAPGPEEPPVPCGWVEALAAPFSGRPADSCRRQAAPRASPASPEQITSRKANGNA